MKNCNDKLKHLFFPVRKEDLFVFEQRMQDYYAVINEKERRPLGVKKKNWELLSNNDVYNFAIKVYKAIFNDSNLDIKCQEVKDKENKMTVLLYSKAADIKNFYKYEEYTNQPSLFQTSKNDLLNIDGYKLLKDYKIVIIVKNYYDCQRNSKITMALTKSDEIDLEQDVDKIGILILHHMQFNRIHSIYKDDKIIEKFKEQIHFFIEEYIKRYQVKTSKEILLPMFFDIYDKKMRKIAAKIDPELYKELRKFKIKAEKFIKALSDFNYASIIEFIMSDLKYSVKENRELQHILSENNNYASALNRSKNILNDTKKRKAYEKEIKKAYDEIKNLLTTDKNILDG